MSELLLSRMPTNDEFEQVNAHYATTEESMTFCGWVTKTKKKKKTVEERLLTVGQYRVATWKEAKLGSALRLAREGHLLHLKALDYLEVDDYTQINLKFSDFEFPFVETLSRGRHLVSLIKNFYALMSIGTPRELFFGLYVNAHDDAPPGLGEFPNVAKGVPFAGFVEAYEGYAARAGIHMGSSPAYRELLDLIVQHAGDHAIELVPSIVDSFEFLDSKTKPLFMLDPFVHALKHNTYFDSLTVSSITRFDLFDALALAFAANSTITTLDCSEVSANSGFGPLGRALVANPTCALTSVDISYNCLKDKGLAQLAPGLATLQLAVLNLSFCQFGAKGMSALAKAFAKSDSITRSLTILELAGNKLGSSGTVALANWLTESPISSLHTLNLSDTQLKVKKFSPLLSTDTTPNLATLNVSANAFSDRAVMVFSDHLMSSAVTRLDMTDAKISIDSLAGVVGCLVSDRTRSSALLDISSIILKPAGAIRVASSFAVALNLHSLCLDDAQLGSEGMIAVLEALRHANGVKSLSLSRNIRPKDKGLPDVVDHLISFVADQPTTVTSLVLVGSSKNNFGVALVPFFDALAANATLTELNVEGNYFRDEGAEALGTALAQNTTIETLFIDNNGMSLAGLNAFAAGVSSNASIINLPIPDAEFKRIILENAGDTDAFDTMRNIIKTLRFAVRYNKLGRSAGWSAPTSLFGDNPDISDEEWLINDKVERRARRAARRAAKASSESKRRTFEASSIRASTASARAKKRETLSISDFKVEDFMEHIGSVGSMTPLSAASRSSSNNSLLTAAAHNRSAVPPPKPPAPSLTAPDFSDASLRLSDEDYSSDNDAPASSSGPPAASPPPRPTTKPARSPRPPPSLLAKARAESASSVDSQ